MCVNCVRASLGTAEMWCQVGEDVRQLAIVCISANVTAPFRRIATEALVAEISPVLATAAPSFFGLGATVVAQRRRLGQGPSADLGAVAACSPSTSACLSSLHTEFTAACSHGRSVASDQNRLFTSEHTRFLTAVLSS